MIQDLGLTQVESTLKTIIIDVENSAIQFQYNLISEIWISEGSGPATGGPSDFQILSPGEECFAP